MNIPSRIVLLIYLSTVVFTKTLLAQDKPETPPETTPSAQTTKKKKKSTITISEESDIAPEVMEEKDVENYKLTNPELINRYISQRERSYDTGEHLFANIFVGAFSGACFGALGSLAVYNSANRVASQEHLIAFSGSGAVVGVLAGTLVTWFEYRQKKQFTIGPVLMSYTWYGAIGGALAGMAVGLIPYGSSGNTDDILKYTGFGALIGVSLGAILFGFQLPENLELTLLPSSEGSKLIWSYKF